MLVFTFGSLIYQLVELIFRKGFKLNMNFSFSDYSLKNNIYLATSSLNGEHILRPVLVGLIFLVVTLAAGILTFEKSDIK